MKVVYTESAEKELERFKELQVEMLEDLVKEEKYLFGDDEVEITASDIREAKNSIRILRRPDLQNRRNQMMILMTRLYAVMGLLTILIGLYYPQFTEMLESNPKQASLILTGVITSVISSLFHFYLKAKIERYKGPGQHEMTSRKSVYEEQEGSEGP